MSDTALRAFLDRGWQRLTRGVADRHAAARHPTLATVSPGGWPEARTVVLRVADRAAALLEVHTDACSRKMDSIAAYPRAALHIWDAKPRLQMRLSAEVHVVTGTANDALWAKVPVPSRLAYGASPAPGRPIPERRAFEQVPDPARFAVLRLEVMRIDLLDLSEPHQRAVFERSDDWSGQWVVP